MTWDLRLGDCLDPMAGLASLPGRSVDVVITDPPYGIGDDPLRLSPAKLAEKGGAGNNDYHPVTDWDDAIDERWCAQCCRVSGVVVWFGHWRKRHEVEAAMVYPLRAEIIWAKDTHTTPAQPVASQDERIWVFSAETVKPRKFSTSVWRVPVIPTWSHKNHKNEKPEALMVQLLEVFTDPGQTILDPFAGSGTTGVAAIRLGRRFLGWEKDPKYHAIATRRLQGTRQSHADPS